MENVGLVSLSKNVEHLRNRNLLIKQNIVEISEKWSNKNIKHFVDRENYCGVCREVDCLHNRLVDVVSHLIEMLETMYRDNRLCFDSWSEMARDYELILDKLNNNTI